MPNLTSLKKYSRFRVGFIHTHNYLTARLVDDGTYSEKLQVLDMWKCVYKSFLATVIIEFLACGTIYLRP